MRVVHWIALILVIIGALNWGIWGVFHVNVISTIWPSQGINRTIYSFIGLAGIWCFYLFKFLAMCTIKK